VKIFLDSSVVLAACGRSSGASRFVFDHASAKGWTLFGSSYVLSEVDANIAALPGGAEAWGQLRLLLQIAPDILSFDWITVFAPAKDRPILFTALAWAEVLLTLDRRDFADLLGKEFYGLPILRPGEFLERERAITG
jgi:predicted nucleic acid-binding protein